MAGHSPWRDDYSTSGFTYVETGKICRVTQEEILASLEQKEMDVFDRFRGMN